MTRKNISSGTKWENDFAYSRAIVAGNMIFVSGTTAVDQYGDIHGVDNIYEQTVFIFEKIAKALEQCGASLENVVRTRMFVTDISKSNEVGKAHGEIFRGVKPAATMIEVSKLIVDDLLIEIEVDAILD